jgi:putative membrane protein
LKILHRGLVNSNAVNGCVVNDTREKRTGVFVISTKNSRADPDMLRPGILFAFPTHMLALLIAGAVYALGIFRLWRRAGRGRGIAFPRVACFAAGLIAIAIALFSPLDAMSEELFSAHMVQHLLLVIVAAPLLVLGEPQYVMLWVPRVDARRSVARWWRRNDALRAAWSAVSRPSIAWLLHVGALWTWHAPRLYDAALRDGRIHVFEHLTFLLTALLFWWVALDRHRLRVGVATFYLFAAGLQGTLLGALLTIARHPWYVAHYTTTQSWGLTPMEDQQLAGLIMWIPAGLVYLVALIPRLVEALSERAVVVSETRPVVLSEARLSS